VETFQHKIALSLVITFSVICQETGYSQLSEGIPAPSFRAKRVGYQDYYLFPDNLQQPSISIIYFWSMSREEIKDLKTLDDLAKKHPGTFKAISIFWGNENEPKVTSILQDYSINLVTLLTNDQVDELYEVDQTPTIFVIDANKRIVLSQGGSRLPFAMLDFIAKSLGDSLAAKNNQEGRQINPKTQIFALLNIFLFFGIVLRVKRFIPKGVGYFVDLIGLALALITLYFTLFLGDEYLRELMASYDLFFALLVTFSIVTWCSKKENFRKVVRIYDDATDVQTNQSLPGAEVSRSSKPSVLGETDKKDQGYIDENIIEDFQIQILVADAQTNRPLHGAKAICLSKQLIYDKTDKNGYAYIKFENFSKEEPLVFSIYLKNFQEREFSIKPKQIKEGITLTKHIKLKRLQ